MAVQELREMVVRGAHEHPGAVAVEDELGRVVLLHKLPREVCSHTFSGPHAPAHSPS